MTLLQLETDVGYRINQDVSGTTLFITKTEVDAFLNRAYEDLANAVMSINEDYFLTSGATNTTAGTQEYTLPTGFKKMKRLEIDYADDGEWKKAAPIDSDEIPEQLDDTDDAYFSTDYPRYYIQGTVFGLRPIPDATGTNNIRYWYIASQTALSAADGVPTIPADFHLLMPIFAAARCFEKMGQFPDADRLWAQYFKAKAEMKDILQNRQIDAPKFVHLTEERNYQ